MFFKAKRPIRSLPPYHGSRWHAWLRYGLAGVPDLDKAIFGILPFRSGQAPVGEGAVIVTRLILSEYGLEIFPHIVEAFLKGPVQGEFSRQSLQLCLIKDSIGGAALYPLFQMPVPFTEKAVTAEITWLLTCPQIHIKFLAPVRLPLPAGLKDSSSELGRFCGADFLGTARGIAHLLARVRTCSQDVQPDLEVLASRLGWEDMRYNRDRRIALGGVTGEVILTRPRNFAQAQALVLGQYFGSGKNARFGLGYWRIRELYGIRNLPLPD